MELNRTQMIITSAFGYLPGFRVSESELEDLAFSLDRSLLTVKKNLTHLKKLNIVVKRKIKYDFHYLLTDKGKTELESIMNFFNDQYFTPARHNISNSLKLTDVIDLVKDPFFKIFLVDKFFKKKKFDLMDTLDTFGLVEDETTVFNLIHKGRIFKMRDSMPNLARSMMASSLYSYGLEEIKNLGEWDEGSYEALLLRGELLNQRGRFQESLDLFEAVLSLRNVPQDIWFIANVGKIKALEGLDDEEGIEELFKQLRNTLTNKIGLAYLNQLEGDILSTRGEYDRSKKLFEKSIMTFHHYYYTQFLAVSYNNYGVLYFNMEDYDEAERMWIIAKRYAIESENEYLIALINSNMASILRWKHNYAKSERLIKETEDIFKEQYNLEKLSGSEYIRSLLLLSKGDVEESFELFERSFQTFPLLSEQKRKERIKVYSREAERLKYALIQNGRKIGMVYKG
ncbi:MAG: tetratricopeptide repeat protein [Thermoplasmatota archaeon]